MKNHAIAQRQALMAALENESVALLDAGQLVPSTADQHYAFKPSRNFYYLTGIQAPNARLMIIKTPSAEKIVLFLEADTPHSLKWEGPKFSKEAAMEVGGFKADEIFYLNQFEGQFQQLMSYARSPYGTPPKHLYLDLPHPSLQHDPVALTQFKAVVDHFKELKIESLNGHLARLRMIKSSEEIQALKDAIAITHQGLNQILKHLKTRRYEYECVADFNFALNQANCPDTAFHTIAASGENAMVLHYDVNNALLPKDGLILFDLGALSSLYAADISRTYPVSGVYEGKYKAMYQAVLDVQKEMIEAVKPGQTWKALNQLAKDRLAEKAVALKLIKNKEDILEVYYHSIGHFLGLDVHDVGLYDEPFKAGMVLTIEPGLYGDGMGVRIEDNILVTETGHENLSTAIEKEISAIESILKAS
jgi:Xaa-Pro aminopeptidase